VTAPATAPGAPEVLTERAAVEALVPEWRELAAAAARSPFESPDWLAAWHHHYAGGARPRVLTWRVDGGLVGVAPLVASRTRQLATALTELHFWAGFGPALRGQVDVLATDEHRAGVLAGLIGWLRDGSVGWDVLNALRVPAGSDTPAALVEAGAGAGWRTVRLTGVVRSVTYVIALPDDLEGWARHLGPKARHNMRTEEHRFERAGGSFEQRTDPAVARDAVEAVRRLMTARWGDEELDFGPDPAFEPFLVDAIGALLGAGSMWVNIARDDSGIRACLVTFALNRRAVALVMGVSYDDDVRKMSLGKGLFDRSISEAIRRGCSTYDFLWAGGYKESFWHAEPRTLESLVQGRGLRGAWVAEAARLRRVVLPGLLGRRRTENPAGTGAAGNGAG
jgi:CelD/BcsL family acetyltransferase involved in cellulose biosynthesis